MWGDAECFTSGTAPGWNISKLTAATEKERAHIQVDVLLLVLLGFCYEPALIYKIRESRGLPLLLLACAACGDVA